MLFNMCNTLTKMARVWFLMTVLINIVIAFDTDIGNCNECIRNGGNWCNKIQSQHCVLSPDDNWCPDDQEMLPSVSTKTAGKILDPVYLEKRLYIGTKSRIDISYNSPTELNVTQRVVNSTQTIENKSIELKVYNTVCAGSKCTVTLEVMPTVDFCLTTGGVYEYVYVQVNIGNLAEESIIKYLIPCACPCSLKPERKSGVCNGNGDLACGVCSCYKGWSGEFCNKQVSCSTKGGCHTPVKNDCKYEMNSAKCNNNGDLLCGECHCHRGWSGNFCENRNCADKRGDLQCTNPAMNDIECSGNGYCGPCETCICYKDREGSQYFDEENYCSDLCMLASDCDSCVVNNTLGGCQECSHDMIKLQYNESVVDLRDQSNNMKVWMKCNETIDDCYVEYYASKNEMEQIQIMVSEHCGNRTALGVTNTKVPIIFGILALLAAIMAIAGVMVWKHINTVPPLPLSDPEYQNIDAEDCTGENPLYKSPMSSFKNPTYGKW